MSTLETNGAFAEGKARWDALADYRVFDTPPERGFDDLASIAARVCRTPVALVTLLGRDRQVFKAHIGTDIPGTPIELAICAHALGGGGTLVIPDLSLDPRTRGNPLVTGEQHVRFYAGAPLVTPAGHTLGTLCVLDRVARPEGLTPEQTTTLEALAGQVMAQLELRRAIAERDTALEEREDGRRVALAEAARLEAMIATQQAVAVAEADLGSVFRAIVEGALRVISHADGAAVELRDGDELVYDSVSGSSQPYKGIRLPIDRTLSGKAVLAERPMHCADTQADPDTDHALAIGLGIRSMVVVPVTRRGEPIGVLKVQSARPDVFSPRDVVMTQMLAGLVASAFGDVAEVKSRRALREAETRYRQTFESVTEFGVIVTDLNCVVTEWNTGAERIFGWSAPEIVGRSAELFFTPEDRRAGRVRVEMRQALRDGRAVDERWHLRKDGSRLYASGNMMPLRGDGGEHLGFIKIVRDRTEQHLDGVRLRRAEEQLRQAQEAGGVGLFTVEVATGTVSGTDEFWRLYGLAPRPTRPAGDIEALVVPEDRSLVSSEATRRSGDMSRDTVYRVRRADTGETRWISRKGEFQTDEAGRPVRFAGVVRDATAEKAAEERRALHNREMAHRLKNTLAIVQSIATQTLRSAPDLASARQSLAQRIQALSKAHDILITGQQDRGAMDAVIRGALDLHDQDRQIHVEGPSLAVGPKAAMTLSLVMHELATNAAKYGALSVPEGRVNVSWTVDHGADARHPTLTVDWIEIGGPPARPPERKGFGTRLIEMGLSGSSERATELHYGAQGLRCRLTASLTELQADDE